MYYNNLCICAKSVKNEFYKCENKILTTFFCTLSSLYSDYIIDNITSL